MSRRPKTLLLIAVCSTIACARSRDVKVPHPVIIRPPPCVTAPPPVPGPEVTPGTAAETRYLIELHAWAWGTWRACRPAAEP